MKNAKRAAAPTGEATIGRVAMQSTPKSMSSVLGYALKGQLVTRLIPHKGKVNMPMGTGYYPKPTPASPRGPGRKVGYPGNK